MTRRTNADWVAALTAGGIAQATALTELRAYLLRAAVFTLNRSRHRLEHLGAAAVDQLAEDCAQEALLAILQHLGTFRGDSRFTTWAFAFAVNTALVAARRERWKRVPLDGLLDGSLPLPAPVEADRRSADPQRHALRAEALAAVREGIEQGLTDRQRQVVKALVFEQVPLDEVARHLASNRNALYKLLHDARRKLRAHVEARGFDVKELVDLFATER
ncbi:MAG TPA: sigma-70 family RNA polymerase sigma factor [Gemmatimonadales bacterium]|nr:sigma-70 family RNA polymerase sigma factor [Gemmatimonadales bacterium]